MKIKEKYLNEFGFVIKAKHVDLTGSSNPLDITVRIGNDVGTTQVRLGGKLQFEKSNNFKRHHRHDSSDRNDNDD